MPSWEQIDARRQKRAERERQAAQSVFRAISVEPTEQQLERVIASLNRFSADIVNDDRRERAQDMSAVLEAVGVHTDIAHFTRDSSNREEYTLTSGDLRATGPTFDLALQTFVIHLLAELADAQAERRGK